MAAPVQPSMFESLGQIIPTILVFGAVFWFMIIQPSRKRQKEQDEMLKNLKRGDRVVTSSGIYAEVEKVEEQKIVLKIADGVKVEFQKQSVVTVLKGEA